MLSYSTCFELLCAVILSAQTTDEQVNAVTPLLFATYPNPKDMSKAGLEEMESIIKSLGFYHTKARHLIQASKKIMEDFGGAVPDSFDRLLSLPGVGRKTANLVSSACFGSPGIIVDTHVMRVSIRLGIQEKRDPAVIEKTIAENLDPQFHTAFSHALNRHGKYACTARHPVCRLSAFQQKAKDAKAFLVDGCRCPLESLCPKIGLGL